MIEKYDVTIRGNLGPGKDIRDETWELAGISHRSDGPAFTETCITTGVVVTEEHWQQGQMHRLDGPASIERDPSSGAVLKEEYFAFDKRHRTGGPAVVRYCPSTGQVVGQEHWQNGVRINQSRGMRP
jgi:hypothetical protein